MTSPTSEPGTPASRQLLTRRNLIASTGLVAAAVSAAPLLGRGTAEAAVAPACPPGTTAPVPPPAKGPAIPKSGYLVEEIGDRVFWLTDLNDSGVGRGWLLIVLCRFSAIVSGSDVPGGWR